MSPEHSRSLPCSCSQCFTAANGDRDDADNLVIIATDGDPYPPFRRNLALAETRRLKEKGVRIFAVGVTPEVEEGFLRGISSGNHYLRVTDFEALQNVRQPILNQLCQSIDEGEFGKYSSLQYNSY